MPKPTLEEIAASFEPKVAAALAEMLAALPKHASLARIEAFIRAGDIDGLISYVSGLWMQAAPAALAVLREAAVAGALAAVDDIRAMAIKVQALNRARLAAGAAALPVPTLDIPFAPGVDPAVVFHGAEDFAYNPVNPKAVAATRTWQGNLIREMGLAQRMAIMDQIREGVLTGQNPRDTARAVRDGLNLTRHQQRIVAGFGKEIDDIVANGLRSAQGWGLYTPSQIAALKQSDPAKFKRLDFTDQEMKHGRRYGRISRATGTTAPGPDGFRGATSLAGQRGPQAWRRTEDGKLWDAMTKWRLRDKSLDPLLYRIVAAREAGDAAAEAKARQELGTRAADIKQRYHDRYVKHRAVVIARTETMRALNLGSYQAWLQAVDDSDLFDEGQVRRYWISARDDRVRDEHKGADRKYRRGKQTVGMHEPFIIGGQAVMIPPAGPNCRCTVGYDVDLGILAVAA